MVHGLLPMGEAQRKPIVLAYAGPNGSGKSTLARNLNPVGTYVNADELKKEYDLTDLEAAQKAEALRNFLLDNRMDFTFETVLSTERNLLLLEKARSQGYEVQCIYVLTCNENINVLRVKARHMTGGHDVPEEKVRSRYRRALELIPRLMSVCDKLLIYDNTDKPALVVRKYGDKTEIFPNDYWTKAALRKLLKV